MISRQPACTIPLLIVILILTNSRLIIEYTFVGAVPIE